MLAAHGKEHVLDVLHAGPQRRGLEWHVLGGTKELLEDLI